MNPDDSPEVETVLASEPSLTPGLHALRVNYDLDELVEGSTPDSPVELFQTWLGDALGHGLPEPNAMTLATIGSDGAPNVRTVLLKQFDERGFSFFTNYESRKGQDIARDPRAALCFLWKAMQRQISIRGTVYQLPREEAEAYFAVRPYSHQIGAWVSMQSQVIPDRSWLEIRATEYRDHFPEDSGQPVPCPEYWGGYVLVPEEIEFWQGRPCRLHDRLRYRVEEGVWVRERLSP